MKFLLIICDGVGDLGEQTPLSEAAKPNIDAYAKKAETGLLYPLGRDKAPHSDDSHLVIFGYNLDEHYPGRGVFEVLGCGMENLSGDVDFRCNLGTIEGGKIIDRRAGRIHDGSEELINSLNMKIGDAEFILKHGGQHRAAVILRGEGLSPKVSDTDPHADNVPPAQSKPLDGSEAAKKTAKIVNEFVAKSSEILENHPINNARAEEGKHRANIPLLRGAGAFRKVPPFQERYGLTAKCVAGGALYKGVARFVGMDTPDIPGADGTFDTDLDAKASEVLEGLESHDFVFAHIKATDNAGHDGDFEKKKRMVEKIDGFFGKVSGREDTFILLTGDHSTPVSAKGHTADPCPLLLGGPGIKPDKVDKFDEASVREGSLGTLQGKDIMPRVLKLLGK